MGVRGQRAGLRLYRKNSVESERDVVVPLRKLVSTGLRVER